MTVVGTASHYAAFVKLARQRIEELGLSYDSIDSLAGWPQRYCATLMCGNKVMSVYSYFTLCAVLALLPTFAHDDEQLVLLQRRGDWIAVRRAGSRFRSKRRGGAIRFNNHVDFYRQIGRKGAITMHARRKRLSAAGRKAALARWGNGHASPD